MRPSILWNYLRGKEAPVAEEAASHYMARACWPCVTVALILTESKTVPRNDIHWLGDNALLARLTLSPRQSQVAEKEGSVRQFVPQWSALRTLPQRVWTGQWGKLMNTGRRPLQAQLIHSSWQDAEKFGIHAWLRLAGFARLREGRVIDRAQQLLSIWCSQWHAVIKDLIFTPPKRDHVACSRRGTLVCTGEENGISLSWGREWGTWGVSSLISARCDPLPLLLFPWEEESGRARGAESLYKRKLSASAERWDTCCGGGREPLYGQTTLWRDHSPHLDRVWNCSQERYPLAGRQCTLGKVNLESQAV